MAKIEPFEKFLPEYERWFEENRGFYLSELNLFKELIGEIPPSAVEIGVGSGRFAAPLGINYGVDPSPRMLKKALERGLKVARGVAEYLPLKSEHFEFALMVTTVCFVDDVFKSFREAARILKNGGLFAVGFVDRNSFLGRFYEAKKERSKFYKPATFYSTEEILRFGEKSGFQTVKIMQTIFDKTDQIYSVEEGFGRGAFVGVLFRKPKNP
jgi:SAM-dependent methyltransferase